MMQEKEFSLRVCRTEDIDSILALQELIFRDGRALADWQWKSRDNPYLAEFTVIGLDASSIVSSYTTLGSNLNLMGTRILAGHNTDTVVHPDSRRKGLLIQTGEYLVDVAVQKSVQVLYGFPNEHALPINLAKQEGNPIAYLRHYIRRLGAPSKLLDSLNVPLLQNLFDGFYRFVMAAVLLWSWCFLRIKVPLRTKFTISEDLPEGYEKLWKYVSKREICSIWKDAEYFNWRYKQHPRLKARYFSLRTNDELDALAVVVCRANEAVITELIVKDRVLATGQLLLNNICRHYSIHNNGARQLVFFGHDRGFFELAFFQFKRAPERDFVMTARVLSNKDTLEPLILRPISWTITAGDTDSVF